MDPRGEICDKRVLTLYHILECPVIVEEIVVSESSKDAESNGVDIPNTGEFRQRISDNQLQNSPFSPDQRRLERPLHMKPDKIDNLPQRNHL